MASCACPAPAYPGRDDAVAGTRSRGSRQRGTGCRGVRGCQPWPPGSRTASNRSCGRFSPGHYQRVSLSSVSAIGDMVAPVVLITLTTIFSNGLTAVGTGLGRDVLAMERERMSILRGPHGEVLDEGSVPPMDRERLTEITNLMPLLIGRVWRIRRAVVIMWIAIGLFVLSVAAIAVAVTANSEAFGFTALALVLAGVAGFFAGILAVVGPMARRAGDPLEAIRHMGMLG